MSRCRHTVLQDSPGGTFHIVVTLALGGSFWLDGKTKGSILTVRKEARSSAGREVGGVRSMEKV